mmetsp:Transcript_1480/g.5049  ORF Transcript_1480/g.5049 Transcript_1480/m.5049 type:complete len:335 (+) Transcript_1480:269-1273(+)
MDLSLSPYVVVHTGTNAEHPSTAALISGAQSPPPCSIASPTKAVQPCAFRASRRASVKSFDSAMRYDRNTWHGPVFARARSATADTGEGAAAGAAGLPANALKPTMNSSSDTLPSLSVSTALSRLVASCALPLLTRKSRSSCLLSFPEEFLSALWNSGTARDAASHASAKSPLDLALRPFAAAASRIADESVMCRMSASESISSSARISSKGPVHFSRPTPSSHACSGGFFAGPDAAGLGAGSVFVFGAGMGAGADLGAATAGAGFPRPDAAFAGGVSRAFGRGGGISPPCASRSATRACAASGSCRLATCSGKGDMVVTEQSRVRSGHAVPSL